MGQIKFFPKARCRKITYEEYYRLKKQQDLITGARNEMLNRISNMPKYWQAVEKSLFHEKFRSRIRAVDDGN